MSSGSEGNISTSPDGGPKVKTGDGIAEVVGGERKHVIVVEIIHSKSQMPT